MTQKQPPAVVDREILEVLYRALEYKGAKENLTPEERDALVVVGEYLHTPLPPILPRIAYA